MNTSSKTIDRPLAPIGVVRNEIQFGTRNVDWKSVISRVEIEALYADGLGGIEDCSHLYLLYFLQSPRYELLVHPKGRDDLPRVGIFCTRSPHRPNPIGLTLVRLLSRRGRVLEVQEADAYNGSLVLDIKPFFLQKLPGGLRFPDWVAKI